MPVDFGTPNLSGRTVRFIDASGNALAPGSNANARIPSAANSNNATVVKATPGQVFLITGHNAAAAVRYVKLYNKATTPAPGTDNALLLGVFACQASVPFKFELGANGLYFSTGIGLVLVTGSSDTDNTSVTAADILGLNVLFA